jgi:hypothetical protein
MPSKEILARCKKLGPAPRGKDRSPCFSLPPRLDPHRRDGHGLRSLAKELAVAENLIRPSRMSVGASGNEFAGFPKRIAVSAKSMAARLRVSERRRNVLPLR